MKKILFSLFTSFMLLSSASCVVMADIIPDTTYDASVIPREKLDRHILITNNSSWDILKVFASNVDAGKYRPLLKKGDVIHPQSSALVNIDDGTGYCLFNLKAKMGNGKSVITRGANVCTGTEWTISDRK